MQQFAALLMSAFVAAAGLVPTAPQKAAETMPVAEVYVAELDADWNVARETRVPCNAEFGCTVELKGDDAKAMKLHVRFDAVRGGAVTVSSAIEDRSGSATVQPAAVVTLDRTGFGATHFGASALAAGDGEHVIMMAVKLTGWSAPVSAPAGGARI